MEGIDLKSLREPKVASEKKGISLDFLNKEISFSSGGFSDKKKESFYSELHILLSSGVDLKTSLEIITQEEEKKAQQIIFKNITDEVISGFSLSDALNETGKFTSYEFHSIKIGEESGRLNEILKELTNFYARKVHQKRQVVGAFSYPVMVLFVAFGAVLFYATICSSDV